ncbi:MAG: hypothetical protein WB630_09330, partial [Candidatus Acidiferrales bacterium]
PRSSGVFRVCPDSLLGTSEELFIPREVCQHHGPMPVEGKLQELFIQLGKLTAAGQPTTQMSKLIQK